MYLGGSGTTKDSNKAMQLLLAAAEKQYSPAQYIVGKLYAKGVVVQRDDAQAYMWCSLAKSNGLNRCDEEHVTPQLTGDQKREADRRVQEWLAKHKKGN